ncbi:MAG TPA: response regulator [Stellaceae bacterium]|jgi:CheY-like chemotaxis protein|nr:response regulator [Stellaceae bacterium]
MPPVQANLAAAPVAAEPAPPAVLVIDDNLGVLRSIECVLETYGIPVATAQNGVEGLALFRRLSPAVVITDIVMPYQDGISAIMTMRREQPGVKIVAISGAGQVGNSDFLSVARQLGADTAMPKPLDINQLVMILRRYLMQAR